jgi:hypothetical protein
MPGGRQASDQSVEFFLVVSNLHLVSGGEDGIVRDLESQFSAAGVFSVPFTLRVDF